MDEFVDIAVAVRKGEELPQEKLFTFLKENIPELKGTTLTLEQFPQGHSNLTYLIRGEDKEFVLRRGPFGSKVKKAHDMQREYTILSRLSKISSLVPTPLFYCEEQEILGGSFYVMPRLKGLILRRKLPKGLTFTPEMAANLSGSFIDQLAELHQLDYQKVGLEDIGKPVGYVKRQVLGWIERYFKSQTDEIKEIEEISHWLKKRIPDEFGVALIHNDYKYDNLVLNPKNPTEIVGILDWEMATIGDPLMDLGTSLAYWVNFDDPQELQQVQLGPTNLPGSLKRKDLMARYQEKTGQALPEMTFYYCFALLKIAVIAQQIYYRYANGLTQDPRFAPLIDYTRLFGKLAVHAAEKGIT